MQSRLSHVPSNRNRRLDLRAPAILGSRGAVAAAAVGPEGLRCCSLRTSARHASHDDRRHAAVKPWLAHTDPGRPRDKCSGVDPPAVGSTAPLHRTHPIRRSGSSAGSVAADGGLRRRFGHRHGGSPAGEHVPGRKSLQQQRHYYCQARARSHAGRRAQQQHAGGAGARAAGTAMGMGSWE